MYKTAVNTQVKGDGSKHINDVPKYA